MGGRKEDKDEGKKVLTDADSTAKLLDPAWTGYVDASIAGEADLWVASGQQRQGASNAAGAAGRQRKQLPSAAGQLRQSAKQIEFGNVVQLVLSLRRATR